MSLDCFILPEPVNNKEVFDMDYEFLDDIEDQPQPKDDLAPPSKISRRLFCVLQYNQFRQRNF